HPFTDIHWTIPELCSVILGQRKKLYCFAVDEKHVFKIDSQCAHFLSHHISERIHMSSGKLAAYTQHRKIASSKDSFNSATHVRRFSPLEATPSHPRRQPP